jgi:hypothetical protein
MNKRTRKSDGPSEAVARAGSELTMPVPRDEIERNIVDSIGSRSRLVYILIAISPLSCLGTHLVYARSGRGCAGCLGVFALSFVVAAAGAMAFLLGVSDSWAQSVREKNPNDDPRESAIAVVAVVGFLWFLGICAALKWTFRGSAAWKRGQVARATAAIEAKRERERKEAEESARRATVAKQMAELAEMRERHLIPLYGGDPRFPDLVREGRIAIGMTRRAVEDALGEPGDTKEDISVSGRKDKLYFREQVGARGKVSYALEVTLIDGRVVKIKDA